MISLLLVIEINAVVGTTTDAIGENLPLQMADIQIPFIANEGQHEEQVRYYARLYNGTVFVTETGEIVYSINGATKEGIRTGFAVEERFVGSKRVTVSGKGPAATRVSSFKGNDRSKWLSNLPTFDSVDMGRVYNGINLELRAHASNVEKIFTVEPGADPGVIRIAVSGTTNLSVSDEGELVLARCKDSPDSVKPVNPVSFTRPVAYQESTHGREYVEVTYVVLGSEYGFEVGDYDTGRVLVIDPLLASTYLGGRWDDICYGPFIEMDDSGNVYISGFTASTDFPRTPGAYQYSYGGGTLDFFISKLNNDLTTLLASTFLGGSGFETECSIALDDSGYVYAGGYTDSEDYPTTPGAYNEDPNGNYDIVVSKLSNDLTTLIASTYVGGSSNDGFESNRIDLTVGESGHLYFVGQSRSSDFPTTPGAYDSTYNGSGFIMSGDCVVVKMTNDLSNILASTYLGGSQDELRVSIALDQSENVFVCSGTHSSNIPTTEGAYDRSANGNEDVFISKLNSNLTELTASTYFGGGDQDEPHVVEIEDNGNVYISGYTSSTTLPTTIGAYRETKSGGEDGFVSKFDNDLSILLASTYLGGNSDDRCQALTLHDNGDVYVTGKTLSPDFPIIPGTYDDDYNGGSEHGDIFVSYLDPALTTIGASTFLGGTSDEKSFGITLDAEGSVFVGGFTHSGDYPWTSGAYDSSFAGMRDNIVAKLLLEPGTRVRDGADPVNDVPSSHDATRLSQNYPNPFNPTTTIPFYVSAGTESVQRVKITIFDTRGRQVKTLVDTLFGPGSHNIVWDGKSDSGDLVPSGIYFYRLSSAGTVYTRKFTVEK